MKKNIARNNTRIYFSSDNDKTVTYYFSRYLFKTRRAIACTQYENAHALYYHYYYLCVMIVDMLYSRKRSENSETFCDWKKMSSIATRVWDNVICYLFFRSSTLEGNNPWLFGLFLDLAEQGQMINFKASCLFSRSD